jgi:hypothetical protein
MSTVRVYDPAMCCSSGVCGPSVDPRLARFSADLNWLRAQGVCVERFNLAQQPGAFAEDEVVRATLEARGEAALPVVEVEGQLKSSGGYPSRAELAEWSGVGGAVAVPLGVGPRGCCAAPANGDGSTSDGGC